MNLTVIPDTAANTRRAFADSIERGGGVNMISPTNAASLFADPNWKALVAEYAAECSLDGLPPASARFETYDRLEAAGMLHSFAAHVDGVLVGFFSMLACPIPHYDQMVMCSAESFFVAKAYRHHLMGLKLLAAAEEKARELKSPGLLVAAPFGGSLWELLPKLRYRESNRVFFKALPA